MPKETCGDTASSAVHRYLGLAEMVPGAPKPNSAAGRRAPGFGGFGFRLATGWKHQKGAEDKSTPALVSNRFM